jgi:hypothetical protein
MNPPGTLAETESEARNRKPVHARHALGRPLAVAVNEARKDLNLAFSGEDVHSFSPVPVDRVLFGS